MIQLVSFPIQVIPSLSVTKVLGGRVARSATVISNKIIIARFLDIFGLVQLESGAGILVQLEQYLVMIIQGLHLFINFSSRYFINYLQKHLFKIDIYPSPSWSCKNLINYTSHWSETCD